VAAGLLDIDLPLATLIGFHEELAAQQALTA
jgi:hypothetical protein